MGNTPEGLWYPPEPAEKPTIVGYDDTIHPVWFDENDNPHPGRAAILSNGLKVAVRDDRLDLLIPPEMPRSIEDKIDRMEEALHRIAQWADAYPLAVFPEPDEAYYTKAHEVLKANGMTLDRLSAAAMRHVISQVGKIAKDALQPEEAPNAV